MASHYVIVTNKVYLHVKNDHSVFIWWPYHNLFESYRGWASEAPPFQSQEAKKGPVWIGLLK